MIKERINLLFAQVQRKYSAINSLSNRSISLINGTYRVYHTKAEQLANQAAIDLAGLQALCRYYQATSKLSVHSFLSINLMQIIFQKKFS